MHNHHGSDPSGPRLFLVPRRAIPPAAPVRDHPRWKTARRALLPLAFVGLAISAFTGFGRENCAEIKHLLIPALPSMTAFLGAAAGARFGLRRGSDE